MVSMVVPIVSVVPMMLPTVSMVSMVPTVSAVPTTSVHVYGVCVVSVVPMMYVHSKNDYVKMTHFVKMTYCQGNKSMLLLHTSSYYNKVMLH